MSIEVWIGTSGYSFPDWVGPFYPPNTPAGRMLRYYARHFPLTELNYTFYRVPTPRELIHLVEKAPAGFRFVVKLYQSITHELKQEDAPAFQEALAAMSQTGALLGVLAQFPERFHNAKQTRAWVEQLAQWFGNYTLAVEFRHRSWDRETIRRWLHGLNVLQVSVDVPPLPTIFPTKLVLTDSTLYLRLHSRRAATWYADDKARYDYLYKDEELLEWVEAMRQARPRRAWILFNNCHRGQAAINAQRMEKLLRSFPQDFNLVPPPAYPEDSLFR
ncbi:hypothetical protein HRbin36_01996 [bacterium HR36]|nr:hypothetical protein HRbin36_01996 [bacterium HR36]